MGIPEAVLALTAEAFNDLPIEMETRWGPTLRLPLTEGTYRDRAQHQSNLSQHNHLSGASVHRAMPTTLPRMGVASTPPAL